jgi:UDP-N-acetylmuramyl pentapeptide phosphotransferase/UDP-N-acetylglucosamine-1-phosphate transferase
MLNAFNLLDNMDALSGGVAWIAAVFLTLIGLVLTGPDRSTAGFFVVQPAPGAHLHG